MKAVAIHVKDSILCLSFYDWIRVTLPRMGFAVGCETILLFVLNIYHPLKVRFYPSFSIRIRWRIRCLFGTEYSHSHVNIRLNFQ